MGRAAGNCKLIPQNQERTLLLGAARLAQGDSATAVQEISTSCSSTQETLRRDRPSKSHKSNSLSGTISPLYSINTIL